VYIRRALAGTAGVALVATAVAVVGGTPVQAAPAPDLTFTAAADAYVAEATPTQARGASDPTNCSVNDDLGTRTRCLVQFVVSGLGPGDTVTGAELRIVDKGDATGTKLVNASAVPTFTETSVTWTNMGTVGPVLGSDSTHLFGQDSVFPLPASAVPGNGTVAFGLWSPPGSYPTGMNFQPKDNTVGKPAPRLVLHIDHVASTRFPGDPGVGKIRLGLNDVAGYEGVEAALPARPSVHRVYNNGNWGVPVSKLRDAIAVGEIPWVSWGFSPYTESTVPQSEINTACDALKSVAPAVVWAVPSLHEPEDNVPAGTRAAAYRQLQRNIMTTCDARGVTNVAWTSPTYQRFTFTAGSGRDWRQWNAAWNGGNTHTAADFTDAGYDIDAMDQYIPLIGSTNWRTSALQWSDMLNRMAADGYTPKPLAIAEGGIKSDLDANGNLVDPNLGPDNVQGMFDASLARGAVAVSYWTSGGDSFFSGPMPSSDPQALRQKVLQRLVVDPRVVPAA
jgi:hypothetical protein